MADLLVYSEKTQTACELAAKGREFAQALGLGVSAAALGEGAAAAAPELGAWPPLPAAPAPTPAPGALDGGCVLAAGERPAVSPSWGALLLALVAWSLARVRRRR